MEWDVKPSCHLAVKKARMVHEQKSPASRQGFLRPSETGMDISEEPVDKPGSVVDSHPSRTPVTRCLEQPTREPMRAACGLEKPMFPYLALLQVGFAVPLPLPAARCALTAPFHPCRHPNGGAWRFVFCGTFRRLAPPRRYLAPCPAEPGLSSPPTADSRRSGCLTCSRAYITTT